MDWMRDVEPYEIDSIPKVGRHKCSATMCEEPAIFVVRRSTKGKSDTGYRNWGLCENHAYSYDKSPPKSTHERGSE